jgi:excisionase family DNA binding protein
MPRRCSPIDLPPFSDLHDPPTRRARLNGDDPYGLLGTEEPARPAESILLTVAKVAARLRMSTKTVRRRIKEGVIRTVPLGGRLTRVSPDELQRVTASEPLPTPSETSI